MSEKAELVNLCADETPRRPTKRIRPERVEQHVLSLIDSDGKYLERRRTLGVQPWAQVAPPLLTFEKRSAQHAC